MLGEDQKLVVEHHAARRRVMVRNRGSRVVEQDFLGHPAEPGKGALEAVEPALLPLVAKRPHMQPTRVAERGDKQERLDLGAPDLNQALAKVDLQLLAGRGLKARRGARQRRKLLAKGP